jgi:trk system potassium uptake protein
LLPKIWPAILTLGWILLTFAAVEALMALFSHAAGDGYVDDFALSAAVTALVGGACVLTTKGRPFELRFRDAALLTVVAWFLVPAFAAIPLLGEPVNLTPVDAYFEMVSGITTTGSTVLSGLDTMAASLLLWRSAVSWMGGIGIIGLALVILPFLKIGGMQLFRLESTDRSEKSMPRVRSIAATVGRVYLALTVACFLTYWALGMTPFDALTQTFATVCTGGFGTHDSSFVYFDSKAIEWAAVVFMMLGAMPFLAFLRLIRGGSLRDRIDPQIKTFVTFLAIATVIFALWLHFAQGVDPATALTNSAFNIVSIVTTTGFASVDYLQWGAFAAAWFFALTFVGGCTGSTSGGIKIFRFQVLTGVVAQHVRTTIYPHSVTPIRYGGRVLGDEQIASVGVFVFAYLLAVAMVAILLAAIGLDTTTALSAAATAIGNVGPGVSPEIGPVGNFAALPDAAKVILSVAMVMGRLEILVVLLLFVPSFYR